MAAILNSATSNLHCTKRDDPEPPHFATRDFCPWANRYVYWLKRPLAQLSLAAAASLAIGIWVVPQGFVAFGGLAVAILAGLAWPWLALRGIVGRIEFSRLRATEGELVEAKLFVENRWPFPVFGLLLQNGFRDFQPSITAEERDVEVALACVPGWSTSEFTWTVCPNCRGEYPRETPILATEFPFGLWRVTRPTTVASRLLVWPYTTSVCYDLHAQNHVHHSSNCRRSRRGGNDETVGTRPFRQGDSLRQVHWSLTAQHDKLISREREAAQASAVQVLVDLEPNVHVGEGGEGTREWALRLGMSVVRQALASGSPVTLSLGRWNWRSQGSNWQALGDQVARLNLNEIECTFRPVEAKRGSHSVVVTTRKRAESQEFTIRGALVVLDTRTWEALSDCDVSHEERTTRNHFVLPNATAARAGISLVGQRTPKYACR